MAKQEKEFVKKSPQSEIIRMVSGCNLKAQLMDYAL